MEILRRRLDRDEDKNLGVTCVQSIHKALILIGPPGRKNTDEVQGSDGFNGCFVFQV